MKNTSDLTDERLIEECLKRGFTVIDWEEFDETAVKLVKRSLPTLVYRVHETEGGRNIKKIDACFFGYKDGSKKVAPKHGLHRLDWNITRVASKVFSPNI